MSATDYTPQELVEVRFAADGSIADPNAPTVAECNAATRITQFLVDGPPAPAGSNFVNNGGLDSGFESQVPSTYGGGNGTMTIKCRRETTTTGDSADTALNLFPRDTVGYLIEAPYGVGGVAPLLAAGDVVTIKPVQVANEPAASRVQSRGQLVTAPVDLAFTALPYPNVTVVA